MILYIDTSSSFLYAGIVFNNKLLGSIKENLEKNLSSMALPKIVELISNCKVKKEDIKKIIVVNGPGSFTGIRIGLTIAKTWAYLKKIDISVVSSLEAMALSVNEDNKVLVPMIDARRDYVFSGAYKSNGDLLIENKHLLKDEMLKQVKEITSNFVVITNDNLQIDNCIKYEPDILKIVETVKGRENLNPHGVEPLYLKQTEAEERLND